MKTVLVTGARGFVGRHVLPALTERGWQVAGLYLSGQSPTAPGNTAWHRVDLLDRDAGRSLIESLRPDCLLHLAWVTTPGAYWTSDENWRWVDASISISEAFCRAGGRRIIVAGSCAEYDWNAGLCREDHTPLAPATIYGQAKLRLLEQLTSLCADRRVGLAWARLFHLYGPYEYPSRLVPSVILHLLRGERARIKSRRQIRGYLYASDVAAAFTHLAESDAEGAFNIGSREEIAIGDLALAIADVLTARDRVELATSPVSPSNPARLVADNTKLQKLGWVPNVPLRTGIETTVAWWRDNEFAKESK